MADNTQLFFNEVNGKDKDFDHVRLPNGKPDPNYLNQCKDLIQFYVTECLALPPLPQGNAWEMWTKAPSTFQRLLLSQARKGDIVVWKHIPLYLRVGHIAIFNAFVGKGFTSMDQNWPLKSPCHIQSHTTLFVQGVLRKR